MNLEEVVNDPDIAEPFTIMRSTITPGIGNIKNITSSISAYGVVSEVAPREIEMLVEADKISEVRTFHSTTEMFVTNSAGPGVSDVLQWQGDNFSVLKVNRFPNRGLYFEAIALRMSAS